MLRLLADSPYAEGIVLFNGSNDDERSRKIYAEWYDRHKGSDRVTGSRTADMRSALVDYFRDEGRIMIATETGAEGINLQFCSEVLGAIESGIDFEKRIADIYQRCRHPNEIQAAFDQLQRELSVEINASMTRTRQQLLENFDDEVREKLRLRDTTSKAFLSRYERLLIDLARFELAGKARFHCEIRLLLGKCRRDPPIASVEASCLRQL